MADKDTPMMRQYRRIKADMPEDVILFFRLGDFYEMFFEDAKLAAPILDIALTKRNNVPMCGVPFHALDNYLQKLIRAGVKVAICEQVEDVSASKGIVRREVTRVVTPGTVMEDSILDAGRNNFLAGIYCKNDVFGFALLDLSTGLFQGEEFSNADALRENLKRFAPSECVVPSEQADNIDIKYAIDGSLIHLTACEDWTFEYEAARDNLIRHFKVHSLEGFGCEANKAITGAAGGVFFYVKEDLRRQVEHIRSFKVRHCDDYQLLDETTCGNLDLVPLRGREGAMSLLKVLDLTKTAMGSRKLRSWILRPLCSLEGITNRHNAVEAFYSNRTLLRKTGDVLGGVRDIERLIARISAGSGNARDVVAIGHSLAVVPDVQAIAGELSVSLLSELKGRLTPLPELVELIEEAINDEPPITVKDGGIIKSGYNAELDDLREAATKGRQWLAEYQAKEQARSGIKTIKIRHNKVFGYYIEVSKGQIDNVPDDYIRKQTLVNAERFITPELKEYENKIFGAQDRAIEIEYNLFLEIRNKIIEKTSDIQIIADAIAELDVLAALASRALDSGYVRPVMTNGDTIKLVEGRHPVVEQMPDAERFIPNDTLLDRTTNQLIIITGPNMAGKSTYIRQVALLVVMAHIGSFVPAASADIGLVDRIFTRVGASDDLARGRSTFMVEMQETANILNNATPRSLIILDEIGRGTSTFDGISIAWAVTEYLHNETSVKAKTMFATHYHELTDLALTMPGVKNYNVLVREKNEKVVFLRKIVPGGADKSYGIQVARLAGMPDAVIERAKEILANLEEGELGESGQPKIAAKRRRKVVNDDNQLTLF